MLVYEGDEELEPRPKIKLIDFANVSEIEDDGRDEGFLFGIQNLINYFQEILDLEQ